MSSGEQEDDSSSVNSSVDGVEDENSDSPGVDEVEDEDDRDSSSDESSGEDSDSESDKSNASNTEQSRHKQKEIIIDDEDSYELQSVSDSTYITISDEDDIDETHAVFSQSSLEKSLPTTTFERLLSTFNWPVAILWIFAVFVPNIVIVILIGVVPLGDPDSSFFSKHGIWPSAFVVTPIIMTIVGYLNIVIFFASISIERPFSAIGPLILAVFGAQLILIPIVAVTGVFEFQGIVTLTITFVVSFGGLFINEFFRKDRGPSFGRAFLKYVLVAFFVYVHVLILTMYIITFREAPSFVQPFLTLTLAIVTFVFRKVLLSLTDDFPIEVAMLIAGLWIENMDDMFQTLAYPSVQDPVTYVYIWIVNFFVNISNLLFLTRPWFRFRVWIKAVLSCKCKNMPKEETDDVENDRGHSNNRPGYLRRQVRFLFWKLFSQVTASIFYLLASLVLRFGVNKQYYIVSEDPFVSGGGDFTDFGEDDQDENVMGGQDYVNSCVYVTANMVVVILSGVVGYLVVRFCCTATYHQLVSSFGKVFLGNKSFIGLVLTILTHNGLLALFLIQYHQRVWWAFWD